MTVFYGILADKPSLGGFGGGKGSRGHSSVQTGKCCDRNGAIRRHVLG